MRRDMCAAGIRLCTLHFRVIPAASFASSPPLHSILAICYGRCTRMHNAQRHQHTYMHVYGRLRCLGLCRRSFSTKCHHVTIIALFGRKPKRDTNPNMHLQLEMGAHTRTQETKSNDGRRASSACMHASRTCVAARPVIITMHRRLYCLCTMGEAAYIPWCARAYIPLFSSSSSGRAVRARVIMLLPVLCCRTLHI